MTARDESTAALRCTESGRQPHPDENADDEWRAYSDDLGGLLLFCPECARREFGDYTEGSIDSTL